MINSSQSILEPRSDNLFTDNFTVSSFFYNPNSELAKETVTIDVYGINPKSYSSYGKANRNNPEQLTGKQKNYTIDDFIKEIKTARKSRKTNSSYFESLADSYFANDGKELADYMQNHNRQKYNLEGVEYASLDTAIAGVKLQGDSAKLVGSSDFESKVENFARQYGISNKIAERYILDHEHAHIWQKGLYFDDHVQAERDVESNLMDFYSHQARSNPEQAAMYNTLRNIAQNRAADVVKNYGDKGALSYN